MLASVRLMWDRVEDRLAFPFALPAIKHIDSLEFDAPITFFVGENGTGKSTLLEAIAVAAGFNAEGGSRNFRFRTRSTHSVLHEYLRLTRTVPRIRDGFFLRAESFYNLASEIDTLDESPSFDPPIRDGFGGKSLHQLSHGEAFLATLIHRFRGGGLYLLDEPEAALSPQRQLAMMVRLHELVREGAQFLIATHSPMLMAYPESRHLRFSDEGVTETTYEETEHYQVMRDFMAAPGQVLRRLLDT